MHQIHSATNRAAWNKDKLVGQKPPSKLNEVWAIRIRLQLNNRLRDLTLFDLAIDSKLRGCDLVQLRVRDVFHGRRMATRAVILQRKTQLPVQFEITEQTREAIRSWINRAGLRLDQRLFPSPLANSSHISTRQYARLVATDV